MKVNMAMDGVGVMVAHGVVVTAVHGIIMADMVIITVVGVEEDIIVFMVAAVVGATMEVAGVAILGKTKRLILIMLNLAVKHITSMC
ncbi:hypothetical protein L195_g051279 [Trifolium pratense]|uniref:Uncharacterized protein n=1 Tax=Trifolium pratense TaxID=57577 RepID=A0A2K3JYP5_TRIPR|nr:hypothetical protein L195_g051279 [Trifolium pratense]